MKCANSKCGAEALYFRSGSLHWIDAKEEYGNDGGQRPVWLCSECSEIYVVQPWRPAGEQLRLRAAARPIPLHAFKRRQAPMVETEEMAELAAS